MPIPYLLIAALLAGPPLRNIKTPATAAAADRAEIQRLLAAAPDVKEYPNSARALVLDLADITVRPDGTSRTITRQAIKILTPLGREQESEVRIPFDSGFESVQLVRARTIRPDGTALSVKPTDVRVGQISEYEDAKVLSISMPAVQPGCIIEYEYVTDQKGSQLPGHFWTEWYFQSGFDPVRTTRLTVTTPKGMPLRRKLRNAKVEPTVKDAADGKTTTYVWEQKNLPDSGTEPMMPPLERVLPKLTLSSVPDWQTIAGWYGKLAHEREIADPTVKAKALELTKDLKTPEEKARAVFYYVQDKTRYIAIELGQSAYQPRPAGQTFSNEYGDCKDMATLLVAMLRSIGITAYPVLLEAGEKYSIQEELPAPTAFNHALCVTEIGGKKYWLDATAAVCPWGTIPSADRGCEVLVIRDGKGAFETIPEGGPDDATSDLDARLTLNDDGSASGTITLAGNGDYAMGLRSSLLFTTQDRMKMLLEQFIAPLGANPKVESFTIPDAKDRDAPMAIQIKARFPSWATVSGDLLIFKARIDQGAAAASTPFTDEERILPIYQASARRQHTRLTLTLPSGYSVLSAPKDTKLASDLGTFARSVTASGSSVTVDIENEDRKAELPPSRYGEARKYIDSFLKAFNESVIVKKN